MMILRSRRLMVLVITVLSTAIMLAIFSSASDWKRGLTTNRAWLDPEASDPLLRPLSLALPPEQVADKITSWVESQSRWRVVSREQTDATIILHLTRTTRLFRFVDDVHVRLEVAEDGTRVQAESRSRVGKGDLGQNPRNLKELIEGLH